VLVKPAPEQYTALEQALTRLQKRYAELEAKVAAQPAPVQEPVVQSMIKALTHAVEIAEAKRPGTWDDLLQYRVLLNTPPAQRQWVGLTREERLHFLNEILDYGTGFVAPLDSVIWNIETKLKEKNHG
jgi:hypothetical protein